MPATLQNRRAGCQAIHFRALVALVLAVALVACWGTGAARAQTAQAPPRAVPADVTALRARYERAPRDLDAALGLARALAAQERIEARREAVRVLLDARRHHPESAELRIVLADLYDRQGFRTLARNELRAALALTPESGPAYARLGRLALRDWIRSQRPDGVRVTRRFFDESLRADPDETEAWLGLGVLALFEENGREAQRCALECLAAHARRGEGRRASPGLMPQGPPGGVPERATAGRDPRGEALLLLGAAAYLQGQTTRADSAFREALPRLGTAARAHLTDITPAATDEDTLAFQMIATDSRAREEFLRRFWRARDPDLTTAVNELELEFLARGALAYFLFFDQRRQRWDERGALLVRYGKPETVDENPLLLGTQPITQNVQLWSYPSLGMDVLLEDRYLSGAYDLPISLHEVVDPQPDAERVAEGVANGSLAWAGRGLFLARTRGTAPLPANAQVAQFRRVAGFDPRLGTAPGSAAAGRVEVYVSVPERGAGTGALDFEAVAFDSTWQELGRARGTATARCAADAGRVTQLALDLPPGAYTIGVSARAQPRSAAGGRTAATHWRLPVAITPVLPGKLELSDLEVACGLLGETDGGPFDKHTFAVVPSAARVVRRGQPLGVYFEVYGLVPDEAGRSRLEVEYAITSMAPDKRPFFIQWFTAKRRTPRVQVRREDATPGRARFQYVTADLENAEPGAYELEVRVSDRQSGQTAERRVRFDVLP